LKTILIVDDHLGTTEAIEKIVAQNHHHPLVAQTAERALEIFNTSAVDLIITDMKLPGQSGLDLLRQVREIRSDILVIVITAFGTIQNAVEAMKLGAFDYVSKPFTVEEIELKINKAFRSLKLAEQGLSREAGSPGDSEPKARPFPEIVGQSKKMQSVFSVVSKAAAANSPVLILGESGTGKELIARALHYNSPRKGDPFVKVNCAALAEGVLESELFGHERGAFTGAVKSKPGRFEMAAAGTIFLDEIGEISLATQVKLLRVLQEKEFERVGGTQTLRMQARVVAATNRDLVARIQTNLFRKDLYYRLNVVSVHIPSLRERLEDIPALVQNFVRKVGDVTGKNVESVSADAMNYMLAYSWPGNIRELENVIERASVLSENAFIDVHDLSPNIIDEVDRERGHAGEAPEDKDDYARRMDDFEKQLIFKALMESRGNISQAAKVLGLKRTTLRYKMEKHDLLRFRFE